jgi:hypothetical protein
MYVMNEDLVPDIIERIEEGGTGEVLGLRVLLYKLIDLFLNVVQRSPSSHCFTFVISHLLH